MCFKTVASTKLLSVQPANVDVLAESDVLKVINDALMTARSETKELIV